MSDASLLRVDLCLIDELGNKARTRKTKTAKISIKNSRNASSVISTRRVLDDGVEVAVVDKVRAKEVCRSHE